MRRRQLPAALTVALAVIILMACAPAGGGSPGPSTAADAARLVLAVDQRFAGIGPRDADLIGQSAWYEVTDASDGWRVQVYIGWGDCPAGCISHHIWLYHISRGGTVELLSQEGEPLPGESGMRGVVTAGPTCPVVTDPPDPNCAERPVAGAELVIRDVAGAQVASVTSGADGSFAVALAPGAYEVLPQPVDGLLDTPVPLDVRVEVGEPSEPLAVSYDTGIR
jgi:hypothetical protein